MRILQDGVEHTADAARFFQDTLDALPQHICLLDERGRIVLVNDAWVQFGRENGLRLPDSALGVDYVNICRAGALDGNDDAAQMARALRDVMLGHSNGFELDYACHSPNEQRWFAARARALTSEGQRFIVVAHEDVTARREAVRAWADRTASRAGSDVPDDVHLLVGLATGRVRPTRTFLDLAPRVEAICSVAVQQLPEGARTISHRVLGPLPVAVDGAMVIRAILHLVLNAFDATRDGGHIHIGAFRQLDQVVVVVRDNGRGLAPEGLAAAMDVPGSNSKDTPIGLSLVKRIAAANEIGFSIASEGKDRGTIATLVMPVREPPSL